MIERRKSWAHIEMGSISHTYPPATARTGWRSFFVLFRATFRLTGGGERARALRPRGTPADAAERTSQVALSALDAEIATSRSFASASAGPAAAPKPLYDLVSAACTLNGPSFISAFHQPPHSQPNTPRRNLTQANNSPSSAASSPRISTSRAPHPPPAPPGCDGVRRVALCVFGLAFWPSEE